MAKRPKEKMYLCYTSMGLRINQEWYGYKYDSAWRAIFLTFWLRSYEYGDELKVTKYDSAWRAIF